jgi:hypothetical protein
MKGSEAIGLGKFVILFCSMYLSMNLTSLALLPRLQLSFFFTIFLFELFGHPAIAYMLFSLVGMSRFVKVEAMVVDLPLKSY